MLLIRTESISGLALKGLHLRLQSPNLGLIADRSASRVICSSERKGEGGRGRTPFPNLSPSGVSTTHEPTQSSLVHWDPAFQQKGWGTYRQIKTGAGSKLNDKNGPFFSVSTATIARVGSFSAFFEIYKISIALHRSDLEIQSKIATNFAKLNILNIQSEHRNFRRKTAISRRN